MVDSSCFKDSTDSIADRLNMLLYSVKSAILILTIFDNVIETSSAAALPVTLILKEEII